MFAKHACLLMLKVTFVTFEINLQMMLLNMSLKVAVALHFIITIKTLIQSVIVSVRKFDHCCKRTFLCWLVMQSDVFYQVASAVKNLEAFFTLL